MDKETNSLNPWSSQGLADYNKLFDDFGIEPFVTNSDLNYHRYMRRGIVFGQRNFGPIENAIKTKTRFSVLDGFMPSGKSHIGHKMVMDQIIWYQKQGAEVFVGIADMEAYAVRNFSWEKCKKIGIDEYIISLIALGLKPEKTLLYFQSALQPVKDLAFELGTNVTFSELSSIYGFAGETHLSHMVSTTTQAADILLPQLEEFGGPCPVVVPAGADQDPHIRLTRGLASKMNMFYVEERNDTKSGLPYISVRGKDAVAGTLQAIQKAVLSDSSNIKSKLSKEHVDFFIENNCSESSEPFKLPESFKSLKSLIESHVQEVELSNGGYCFMEPSSTYHRFMSGLQGGKMSSSVPESHIALTDDPASGGKKVKRAKTGGRATFEEQKELGGNPDDCSVYELMYFHLSEDDKELEEIRKECVSGKRLCGTCKSEASERMTLFLKEHAEKRECARDTLSEFIIKM
ncbi:MAG: tryptophan--tRNA ligase [Methanosarcinaceae archaeon]|nr:tryptophan--tRNA ligase [Methanosarcinaceae archaeon]